MCWAKLLAVGLLFAAFLIPIASSQRKQPKPVWVCDDCPTDVSPVCANGITYQHRCLAECQGQVQAIEGACAGEDIFRLWTTGAATEAARPEAQAAALKTNKRASSSSAMAATAATVATTAATAATTVATAEEATAATAAAAAAQAAAQAGRQRRPRATDMRRFRTDGFAYVGSLDLTGGPSAEWDPSVLADRLRASPGDFTGTSTGAVDPSDDLQVRGIRYHVDTGDLFMETAPRPVRARMDRRTLLAAGGGVGGVGSVARGGSIGWTDGSGAAGRSDDTGDGGSRRRLLGDNRWRVQNGSVFPYSAMAYLTYNSSSGRFQCSAVFITPWDVLTAAHCVWDFTAGLGYTGWRIYPGLSTTAAVTPWTPSTSADYVTLYRTETTNRSFTDQRTAVNYYDIALIRVRNSASAWLGIKFNCGRPTYPKTLACGYSDAVNFAQCSQCFLSSSQCRPMWMMYNYCYSRKGQSGMAILDLNDTRVLGVLSGGPTDQWDYSYWTPIDPFHFGNLVRWMWTNSTPGSPRPVQMPSPPPARPSPPPARPSPPPARPSPPPARPLPPPTRMSNQRPPTPTPVAPGVSFPAAFPLARRNPSPLPPSPAPPPPPAPLRQSPSPPFGINRLPAVRPKPPPPPPPPPPKAVQRPLIPVRTPPPPPPPPPPARARLLSDASHVLTESGFLLPTAAPTTLSPARTSIGASAFGAPPMTPTTEWGTPLAPPPFAPELHGAGLSDRSGGGGVYGGAAHSPLGSPPDHLPERPPDSPRGFEVDVRSATSPGTSPGPGLAPAPSTSTGSGLGQDCKNNDLRLTDGPNSWSGRLEFCRGGRWGTICDVGWGWDGARVACRQLGFPKGGEAMPGGWFPSAAAMVPIHITNLTCLGSEARLGDCSIGTSNNTCNHKFDAGVICASDTVASPPPAANFTNGSNSWKPGDYACNPESALRLVSTVEPALLSSTKSGNISSGSQRARGRLEVCIQGQWGSVCNDGWSNADAAVACRQFGYVTGWALSNEPDPLSPPNASNSTLSWGLAGLTPGPLNMSIWLSGVDCSGSERNLMECRRRTALGQTACTHYEDAGVVCFASAATAPRAPPLPPPPECSEDGALRLAPLPGQPQGAGRLEVCYAGRFGQVCDTGFGLPEARVACRQLGYLYGRPMGPLNSSVAGDPGAGAFAWMDSVRCSVSSGDSANVFWRLTQCLFSGWGGSTCDARRQAVGLLCSNDSAVLAPLPPSPPPPPPNPFSCSSPGSSRLAGGNRTAGRVELCSSTGLWGTVCDSGWGSTDAVIVCRELGFSAGTAMAGGGPFPPGNADQAILVADVSCTGSEARLSACSSRVASAVSGCGDHRRDAGVVCWNTQPARPPPARLNLACDLEGAIRIVASTDVAQTSAPAAGRLEVCHDKEWGAICTHYDDPLSSWDDISATVMCRQFTGIRTPSVAKALSTSSPVVPPLPAGMRFWKYNVICDENVSEFLQCEGSGWVAHRSCTSQDVAGVRCA